MSSHCRSTNLYNYTKMQKEKPSLEEYIKEAKGLGISTCCGEQFIGAGNEEGYCTGCLRDTEEQLESYEDFCKRKIGKP